MIRTDVEIRSELIEAGALDVLGQPTEHWPAVPRKKRENNLLTHV
jgi:hypothetical protein